MPETGSPGRGRTILANTAHRKIGTTSLDPEDIIPRARATAGQGRTPLAPTLQITDLDRIPRTATTRTAAIAGPGRETDTAVTHTVATQMTITTGLVATLGQGHTADIGAGHTPEIDTDTGGRIPALTVALTLAQEPGAGRDPTADGAGPTRETAVVIAAR